MTNELALPNQVAALLEVAKTPNPTYKEAQALYDSYAKRPLWERLEMANRLQHLDEPGLLDMRELFDQKEAWQVASIPRDFGHWDSVRVPQVALAPTNARIIRFDHRGFFKDSGVYVFLFDKVPRGVPINRKFTSEVPPVPRSVMPTGWQTIFRRYFLLFDTTWIADPAKPPFVDPYLLEKVGVWQYRVVAQWDITPREAELMRMMRL